MMEQQHDKDKTLLRIIGGGFIVVILSGLILIVMAAITAGTLEELISGVVKLGLIVIVLSGIGVVLFKVFGVTWLALLTENHRHIEDMTSKGYLPNNNRYRDMRQVKQIDAPRAQPKIEISQIIFNPNALRESAVNLLLFSMRQCGPDQNRIASGPECAMAGVNGYTPRTWTKIVKEYLEPRYGVVTQRGSIENGGGTYVPDEYKTVEELYRRVMLDSAVEDLPDGKR